MFKAVTLALSCAFILASCGGSDDATDDGLTLNNTIAVNGETRQYHLYLPAQPEGATTVFLLHGHGGSADQILGLENTKAPFKVWLDIARRENLILVIPDGAIGSDDKKGWNDCRSDARTNPPTDDVQFLSNLIAKIRTENALGTRKVFINGISNGGFMTQRLAEEIPEALAAASVIVTSRPGNTLCENSPVALPIMFMNGTADPILPYDGGSIVTDRGAVSSTQLTIDYWVNRNQTDTTPIETTFPDNDTEDGSIVKRFSYRNGTNGSVVEHYEVVGGGHTEPSIAERYGLIYKALVGSQNGDIEMADEVWDFFKQYRVN